MSDQPSSNRQWVEQEFGGVSLGDKRRDARLLEAATAMADQPTASNPQRFELNELRCFYRMINGPRATLDILQECHRERTRARMEAVPNRVLVVHDTTELDFTDHPAVHSELGPIGTGGGVGLLQHNSLAFDPEGKQLLGLIDQQLEKRQPKPKDETRGERALRPNKESRLWLLGFRGVGRCPSGSQWIDVCDRGGDYFEGMWESRHLGHDFLIRVCHDRRVTMPETDEETGGTTAVDGTLRAAMMSVEPSATKVVRVASRGGRPGREAVVRVGYRRVRLQPPQPDGFRRGLMPMEVTLVRAWEDGATEARAEAKAARERATAARKALAEAESEMAGIRGAKARKEAEAELVRRRAARDETAAAAKAASGRAAELLDWWLGTSCRVGSAEDALRSVSDYEWRWPVAEEYHKVEKSGLRIEGQRFETAAGLTAALAVVAVVAVRLLQLRYARDERPNAPAESAATPEEIEMVAKATKFAGSAMTVREFVDRVARLGGFLGRKGDGPPGWMSLWRGYQRLTDLLLGQRLARAAPGPPPKDDDPD